MDRFIVREPRVGADYPQENQIYAFATNAGNNRNMIPETMYFGGFGTEFPVQRSSGVMAVTHVNSPHLAPNLSSTNQVLSGIDPRYLAAYADNNASYISGSKQQRERELSSIQPNGSALANEYENRSFIGVDRNKQIPFSAQMGPSPNSSKQHRERELSSIQSNGSAFANEYENRSFIGIDRNKQIPFTSGQMGPNSSKQQIERELSSIQSNGPAFANEYENRSFIGADRNRHKPFGAQMGPSPNTTMQHREVSMPSHPPRMSIPSNQSYQQQQKSITASTTPNITQNKPSPMENDVQKAVIEFPKSRADRLRDLQKSGSRAFSGPVEKVLKWHKVLQELGIVVLYEIVAKCVSVQAGKGCAKTLVVRDDSGPAVQVVYYEIDFLLPELKPPCTIRVIGRMIPGTCRLQAFSVRPATGDDVSTLPRRAAVAAHHVSKLCKEFGHP